MEIIEYFSSSEKEHWLGEIQKADWTAAKYLHELLSENKFFEFCGEGSKLLLLTEGSELVSFCTYAFQDEIREPSMYMWVGFVYTFPEYRGRHCAGILLEHARSLAKSEGRESIFISTDKTGLYEKYGFTFYKTMTAFDGEECRIYRKDVK